MREIGGAGRDIQRRELLLAGGMAAAGAPAAPLNKAAGAPAAPACHGGAQTIAEIQAAMQSGRLTAQALAEIYLQRIQAIDRNGPTLRSVQEINPDAIAIAKALDDERRTKGPRGPLHGIPALLKDNIATADK